MKIELLDHCASDLAVVNAARVSLDKWSDGEWQKTCGCTGEDLQFCDHLPEHVLAAGDDKLLGFLMKNHHGTPFEHGYFQFRVEAPIFVFREWHRHRVGHSYNEMSGRYSEMEKKFYMPESFRMQVGKPGAYSFEEINLDDPRSFGWINGMESVHRYAWHMYQSFLAEGMAKEQARAVLPLGLYSKMIWSCNPRSLMHFLGLRTDPQAMKEIRDLAADAMAYFEDIMPVTAAAFEANDRVAP